MVTEDGDMAIEYPRSTDYDRLIEQLTAARDEIHRLNQHLAKSEDRADDLRREYRKLSQYAQEVLFTAGADGRLSYVAEGITSLLGYEPRLLVGRELGDLVVLPEERVLEHEVRELMEGRSEWFGRRFPIRSSTGRTIPTLVVAIRLEGGPNSLPGLIGLLRDVSEDSLRETELRRHADILNAVADSARRFLRTTDWREHVPGFLEEIASAARVCRAYLYENFTDLHGELRSRLIAHWVRRNDPSQPSLPVDVDFSNRAYEVIRDRLEAGTEIIEASRNPDEAVMRQLAERRLTAQYMLPVFVEEQWWGFLGFDEWYSERDWSPAESQAFNTATRILGAAIRQSETNRRLSQVERLTRVQRDITSHSEQYIDQVLLSVADTLRGFRHRSIVVRDASESGIRALHADWPAGCEEAIRRETRRLMNEARDGAHRYYSSDDLAADDALHTLLESSIKALAVLPVCSGRRVLGLLLLGTSEREYIPTVLRETLESTAAEAAGVLTRFEAEESTRRNRERLHETNERYALATSAGRVGVWDYRRGVGFHFSALLETAIQKSDHVDANPWPLLVKTVSQEHRPGIARAVRNLIMGRADDFEIEAPIRHSDGGLLWFSLRANAYRDAHGRIERIIGTANDITSQKQLEERLRKAREDSESLSRAKTSFLAHMSHELKTPLNSIIGYAQVLQRSTQASLGQRDAIDIISRSAAHLLRLIDDVLDASRLESGRLELDELEFNLPVFLQDLSEIVRIQAREKGLRLALVKETNLPVFVRGDEKRLRQVLLNVLNNAVRFTEEGSVTLCAGWYEGNIRFSVEDTGIGIPEDVTERIFQPFYQVDGRRRNTGGSGLGLAITRQLLELMGQELHVESQLGVGTEVWFLFPHREEEDAWDLATTEEYIAPLEDIDRDMERTEGLSEDEIDELVRLAQIGDVGAMEEVLEAATARSRTLGPIVERALRYLREFRIGELKELILSLKR